MPATSKVYALIVAAGRGERAPGDKPKQYRTLAGKAVLRWVLEAFARHPLIGGVQAVIGAGDRPDYDAAVRDLDLLEPVTGGATRQDSVRSGLEALSAHRPEHVLIHDGARPFVSNGLIRRVVNALGTAEAVVPLIPVADTLRRITEGGYEIVPRETLRRAQTPQGFNFETILSAHRKYRDVAATDDAALAERYGVRLADVPGEEMNLKLTTPEDFTLADAIASGFRSDVRTGTGFDVHKFTAGDHVWLCGIRIPHVAGLEGHSDADAGLHAATDAILGAIAQGDIGMHFPPSDPKWRGAPSHIFLARAGELVAAMNGIIVNLDITLICEAPKLAPYRDEMRSRVADILGVEIGRVSVKATTTEGLGAMGRREGIAAQAIATVRLSGVSR